MRISWHCKIGKNVGWKMVYSFQGKDEKKKHGENSTCFHLKHHCGKEVGHFSVKCIQTANTTT